MTETLSSDESPLSHPDAYWRTMRLFGLYRGIIALILFATYFLLQERSWDENADRTLYLDVAAGYLGFSLLAALFTSLRWPRFNRQLTLQVMGDIGFIVVLMFSAGGVRSGLGVLLVIAIAGAALISQGRLALFYAALATITLLLEQTWQVLTQDSQPNDYTHAAMLSLSCFATAWLAHTFAKRARESEDLASRRGIDLENLALVNQLIIRDMQDGVVVVDRELRLRHFNSQAEHLLGNRVGEQAPLRLDTFSPELDVALQAWQQGGAEEAAATPAKLTVNGMELRLRFLPVGEDRRQGAVIFVEDWSRVQSQAQQLKLASLGRLTANIAHEIRNPLSAISHASQLLLEDEGQSATQQRLLQIINDNVHRLDQMVQDVLQLNQRDRARQESVVLGQFLQEFIGQFCAVEKIPEDSLQVETALASAAVRFDPRHLHQILWNLSRNGWRHGSGRPGSLRLRLTQTRKKHDYVIDVLDDGPGVPAEIRHHLFEPFFTTESSGTGLGLYIARELCEANGASIEYMDLNGASCFRIFIKAHHD